MDERHVSECPTGIASTEEALRRVVWVREVHTVAELGKAKFVQFVACVRVRDFVANARRCLDEVAVLDELDSAVVEHAQEALRARVDERHQLDSERAVTHLAMEERARTALRSTVIERQSVEHRLRAGVVTLEVRATKHLRRDFTA
ncbi:hypothetical protein D9M72_528810 [compost metagenome]